MRPRDPGLGNFSQLPPEVRLCIWDWLPPYKYKHLDLYKYSRPGRNTLAILRSSRQLYNEISHHIYHDLDVTIQFRPENIWARARLYGLCFPIWRFRKPDSAIRRGFDQFPFYRTGLTINILAPDPRDGVQLFYLWQKVNELAKLLAKASSVGTVRFALLPDGRHHWISNRRACISARLDPSFYKRQLEFYWKFRLERDLYDHEIVFLPLCRLKNVEAMKVCLHWKCSHDEFIGLDWTLHCFAIHHFSQLGREQLSDNHKALANEARELLPRFFLELSAHYIYGYPDKVVSKTWSTPKRRGRNWEFEHLPKSLSNFSLEEKHGKMKRWTWPSFMLQGPDRYCYSGPRPGTENGVWEISLPTS
ncbi:hypothetical protein BJY04DRAFT_25614 [Aspergillus karnatakaensis]|uniref:uncharacterized protein n=1 Tax=Aspergillus karnatakaensis TaxID=1810916 RepID=UPI003CCE0F77